MVLDDESCGKIYVQLLQLLPSTTLSFIIYILIDIKMLFGTAFKTKKAGRDAGTKKIWALQLA